MSEDTAKGTNCGPMMPGCDLHPLQRQAWCEHCSLAREMNKMMGFHPDVVFVAPASTLYANPPMLAGGGTKHDSGKPATHLLDYVFIEGIARVLAFGEKKYAAHNWRKGIHLSRLLGAAIRHTFAFLMGQDNDPESGESHLYHAGCCLMFAAWMVKNRKDLDDRWRDAV